MRRASDGRASRPTDPAGPPRVLGVDPGTYRTGWGLVAGTPERPRLLDCETIRMRTGESLPGRLRSLLVEFEGLVERLRPTCAAVEAPFHGANARSALHLAHARGVILAVLARAGVPVHEYAPATVKKAVTGSGVATKEQVQAMMRRLLASNEVAWTDDTSDALAAAVCHLATLGHESAVAAAERGGAR